MPRECGWDRSKSANEPRMLRWRRPLAVRESKASVTQAADEGGQVTESPAEPIELRHDDDVDRSLVAQHQQLAEGGTVSDRAAHALVDELGHDCTSVSGGEVDALVPLARQ